MVSFPFGETVTLLDRVVTGTDAHGNDIDADGPGVDLPGVAVLPMDANASAGNEQTQGRDLVVVGLSLLIPPGSVPPDCPPITAVSRMRVRGAVYEVTGEPVELRSPLTGTDAGVQVALKRVTG